MADRVFLCDVLPEPDDGATIILTGPLICGHLIIRRNDALAQQGGYPDGERWFDCDVSRNRPLTWVSYTTYATKAYALGELLAEVEPRHG